MFKIKAEVDFITVIINYPKARQKRHYKGNSEYVETELNIMKYVNQLLS